MRLGKRLNSNDLGSSLIVTRPILEGLAFVQGNVQRAYLSLVLDHWQTLLGGVQNDCPLRDLQMINLLESMSGGSKAMMIR
jgi:hypothetical protein